MKDTLARGIAATLTVTFAATLFTGVPAHATDPGISLSESVLVGVNPDHTISVDFRITVTDPEAATVKVLPGVVADSTPTQVALQGSCVPVDVEDPTQMVCSTRTTNRQPLPAGTYDLAGQVVASAPATADRFLSVAHPYTVDLSAPTLPDEPVSEIVKCQHAYTRVTTSPRHPNPRKVTITWAHKIGAAGARCRDRYNVEGEGFRRRTSQAAVRNRLVNEIVATDSAPGRYKVAVRTTYVHCLRVDGRLVECSAPDVARYRMLSLNIPRLLA